jgi:hypothetical protein
MVEEILVAVRGLERQLTGIAPAHTPMWENLSRYVASDFEAADQSGLLFLGKMTDDHKNAIRRYLLRENAKGILKEVGRLKSLDTEPKEEGSNKEEK